MKNNTLLLLLSLTFASISYAQDSGETIGSKIDDLTYDWDLKSGELNNYEGLSKFCLDQEYRGEFITLLHDIHHYDSALYQRLLKANRMAHGDKQIEKAIKDIEKFEEEYSMKKFIHFLHEECNARSDIEKHAADLRSEVGQESYGGKVYVLENELNKYIKHITRRVDSIRDNVHHLHLK